METVKTGIDFPKLLPPKQSDAAMRCGDWVSIVGLKSRMLFAKSLDYWEQCLKDADDAYNQYVGGEA